MRTVLNDYRRFDGDLIICTRPGNLGVEAERKAECEAQTGSAKLRRSINALFRKWEHDNGFVEGAAEILVPAGYRP